MKNKYTYKAFKFFSLTFIITWTAWFISAYLSHNNGSEATEGTFMGLGLFGPLVAAIFMIFGSKNKELKQDFKNKLINCTLIKPVFLPFIFLLMPVVIVISILLSQYAGQSIEQLRLTADFDIMSGHPIISLIIPFLAPALEEMGWSGYGIDSLKSKFNMFTSTILFSIIWAIWHLPLFFIKGYYHYNLLDAGLIYALNFFISVIPLTFITNWLYYKNNRSILSAITFHAIVVVSCEAFQILNLTKCIITVLLAIIALAIIIADRKFFFGSKDRHLNYLKSLKA